MNEQMGHEHDLELIAALVEGRLDDPAAAEAQAAACSECGAHRDLLVVLAAVAASPSPALDDFESRRLRASVWDELAATRTASPGPSVPWYYRIAPVAAALVLVVGLGVVLGQRSGEEAGMLSIDRSATATFDAARDGTDGAAEDADESVMMDAPSAGAEPAPESDMTMAADEETLGAALGELRASGPDEVDEVVSRFRIEATQFVGSEVMAQAADCVAADSLAEEPAFLSAAGWVDEVEVVFVALGSADDLAEVVVYRTDDCKVVHRD